MGIFITAAFFSVMSAWALTEVIHHGTLFERPRAWLEARGGLFDEWINCAFCMSHWTAAVSAAAAMTAFALWDDWLVSTARLFLLWLSSVRLANWANDRTHAHCRTPRDTVAFTPQQEEPNGNESP